MTRMQAIFEKCATHLLNQGRVCLGQNGRGCVYFGDIILDKLTGEQRQLMCGAAPVLDKEKVLEEEANAYGITEMLDDCFLPEFQNLTELEFDLLDSIQSTHDQQKYNPEPKEAWLESLRILGNRFLLDVAFLKNWD